MGGRVRPKLGKEKESKDKKKPLGEARRGHKLEGTQNDQPVFWEEKVPEGKTGIGERHRCEERVTEKRKNTTGKRGGGKRKN